MAQTHFRNSERGQGTLEYVLLLVIVVTVIYVFGQSQIKPFGQFINTMMGDYLGCLLDKAVLPGEDACSDILTAATNQYHSGVAAGNAAGNLLNSSGNENSTNGKPTATSIQQQVANSRSGGSSGSGDSSSSGGRRSTRAARRNSTRSGAPGSSADGSGIGKNVADEGAGGSGSNKGGGKIRTIKIGNASNGQRFVQLQGLSGLSDEEKERLQQRSKSSASSTATKLSFDEYSTQPKKIKFNPVLRRAPASEDENHPFTFGDFARFLIIGLIILALVLFLASQANQISKSTDK